MGVRKVKRAFFQGLLNFILLVLILVLICFAGYYIYQNYPRVSEVLHIKGYDDGLDKQVNASSSVEQFSENMRFNHNEISYFINSECSADKIRRFKEATRIINQETGIINFYEIKEEDKADILVGCSSDSYETEKNVFVAGEGGPTSYLDLKLYPVILKGKVILYQKEESKCDKPITELHELFHVFGFDHINNKSLIMYPYVDCKQRINQELIDEIVRLYSIEPLAELYFTNASATKAGIYLSFNVQVNNEGLKDAKNVFLEVYEDDKKLDSFNLKDIEFGASQKFMVGNLKLFSMNAKIIKLEIKTLDKEYNKDNNIITIEV